MADAKGSRSVPVHNYRAHPRSTPFHDILLVREEFVPGQPGPRLERFAVDKVTGTYKNDPDARKRPESPDGEIYRATLNIAQVGGRSAGEPRRGPALSTLPLHPSPAASSATSCYLVNPENLSYVTAWTAEEYNDPPGGFDAPGGLGEDTFSVLIASPGGKVYYLEKKAGTGSIQHDSDDFCLREVDLSKETEIWAQLRGGLVAGRARYCGKHQDQLEHAPEDDVVPLVNIESLTPGDRKESRPYPNNVQKTPAS